jgi:hypothetical protein
MDYAEIIIDGKYILDLSGANISIPTTYELIDITNLNRRSGSKTKTISIPRTKTNDKILGIPYNLSAFNQFDKFSSRQITIKKNSFVVFNGLFKLTDVTSDKINLYAFAELSKLKELFGERTLNTLNLSDLDHLYDETIFDTWNGTYPIYTPQDYFYPLIDYGQYDGKTPTIDCEAPNQDIKITDLRPAVYLKRIIKQMIIDSGYTMQSTFFNNPTLEKLMIPFTNNDFLHSVENTLQLEGFDGATTQPYEILDGATGQENIIIDYIIADPLNQYDEINNEFFSAITQTSLVSFTFGYSITNNSINVPAELFIETYDGATWNNFDVISLSGNYQSNNFQQFTNAYNITFAPSEGLRFRINKIDAVADIFVTLNLTIDPSAGGKTIDVGEFVQLAPNLPPMKQSDLFKYCYQMFNWVVFVDEITGVVSIETFAEYYRNGGQKDFSTKLSLTPNPIISYQQTNFARKYDFKYQGDNKDYWLIQYNLRQTKAAQYPFGNGKYYLTQEGEAKTIGEVGFSPTIIEKTFNGTSPNYIYLPTMWQDTRPAEWTTERKPRILINAGLIDISKLSDVYTQLSTEGSTCVVTQIPLCYFQKVKYNDTDIDAFDLNLAFSTPIGTGFMTRNLVDSYYKSIIDQLNISVSLTAYFNLTARDIAELDFSQLWYVEYFNSIFRLNKIIDFEPNGKGLTKVELINVGVKFDYGDIFTPIEPIDYTYLNTEILEDIITENNNDIII